NTLLRGACSFQWVGCGLKSIMSSTPPPSTHLYTLSLHDALPISPHQVPRPISHGPPRRPRPIDEHLTQASLRTALRSAGEMRSSDRKSTRLNSSHVAISYAVFCLKKKINHKNSQNRNCVIAHSCR